MKIYCIRRYKITAEFRKAITKSSYSLDKLSELLGFNIKAIYYSNLSINENHLNKLRKLLGFTKPLQEIKFDFSKNFGKNILVKIPHKVRHSRILAEFIGIMLGDGYLGKNEINISFDKRAVAYQNYVANLCNNLFGLEFRMRYAKHTNTAHLYFYSKFLVNRLQKYGLMIGNKISNNVGIPNWIMANKSYSKSCIRGLIDTDGCIYRCKREKQIYVNFTNFDRKLFEDFKEVTNNLGYHFVKSNKRNIRLYRKDGVARFINDIKPFKSIGDMG